MKSRHVTRREFLVKGGMAIGAASALWFGKGIPVSAQGITKIAPTEGAVGDDFTIIDTAEARLVSGAVALFQHPAGGSPVSAPLTTHHPHMTAQGVVPALSPGVTYQVSVAVNGQSFEVGTFHVLGTVYVAPTISPGEGTVGTQITIDDPQKRIQQGDEARFYLQGGDPLAGTPATGTNVVPDGSRLTAYVPDITANMQYSVAVVSPSTSTIRFQELSFYVSV